MQALLSSVLDAQNHDFNLGMGEDAATYCCSCGPPRAHDYSNPLVLFPRTQLARCAARGIYDELLVLETFLNPCNDSLTRDKCSHVVDHDTYPEGSLCTVDSLSDGMM